MKLSKFVKRAKSESYCMVIHADDSGIWLGTRLALYNACLLYTSPSPRDGLLSRMPSSA